MDPLLGLPLMLLAQIVSFTFTGVGEESLYRGVYYEEMRTAWGEWPAKITDALYFTFSHFPQQLGRLTPENALGFALQTAISIGLTFWYQYVYEWGGLPAVVALHAWGDVIGFYSGWLLKAGNPNTEGTGFSINTRGLSIGFEARLTEGRPRSDIP
jgi:membrane protease YdiL (CAAX protease family)